MPFIRLARSAGLFLLPAIAAAGIQVNDDNDRIVRLDRPAARIISLAPHVTELLFAAGAGERVVAVSAFSDYPQAAQTLPRIGGGTGLDLERIVALQPDLVIAWASGNPSGQLQQLERLGLTVFYSEPRAVDTIATSLERFGRLAGSETIARQAAAAFRREVAVLRNQYQARQPVRVFYQIWQDPLMTVNGEHMISHWLALCGARNVFAALPGLAPAIDVESVLLANPQVIVAGWYPGKPGDWRAFWQRWRQLDAVRLSSLFTVPAALMDRQTPRAVTAARQLCERIDEARQRISQRRDHAATAHPEHPRADSVPGSRRTEGLTGD